MLNPCRHRFTAAYISRLIQASFESPDQILTKFVADMTGFCPSDVDGTPVNVKQIDMQGFNFSKITQGTSDYLFQLSPC
jgi:hypothetical protein